MSRNLLNYLSALVVVLVAAGSYREASLRLLEPPKVDVVKPRPPAAQPTLQSDLANLFPEGSWELGECARVLTSSGVLLFRTGQQQSNDYWRLKPITLIVGRGLSGDPTDAPIILNAPEGAEVEFSEPFEPTNNAAPAIKIGRMIGEVQISRVPPPDQRGRLTVRTKDVFIDNQKVWTTENIDMRIDDARMTGRDLTIFLAASAATAAGTQHPSSILDRMELVYLEDMQIPLDSVQSFQKPRRIGAPATKSVPGHVSISCQGKLSYDFVLDQLSLRDSVAIIRKEAGDWRDAFTCDAIDLVLRDPADKSLPRNSPIDWVDQVRAYGTADAPAKLSMREQAFDLLADLIDFDAQSGLLSATGNKGIQINRGAINARLASLTYQFDPSDPERIGSIDVIGPGIVNQTDPEVPVRSLGWKDGFRLQPMDEMTLDAMRQGKGENRLGVRIDGQVTATLTDGGSFRADAIEGKLKLSFDKTTRSDAAVRSAWNGETEPKESDGQVQAFPEELHAIGNVTLTSELCDAATQQLSLFFEPYVATVGQPQPGDSPNQPADLLQPSKPEGESQPQKPKVRPTLKGDLITAQFLVSPERADVKDVSIRGNVEVRHQVSAMGTELPVRMTGDSMRLIRGNLSQGTGQDRLQLGSGGTTPAYLQVADGFFVGPAINIWPSDGVIRVGGAGRCQVPTPLLENLAGNNKSLSDIRWTKAPDCRWQNGLDFDGQVATLSGGVTIGAELVSKDEPWKASLVGDQLRITLTNRVDLTRRQQDQEVAVARVDVVQLGERPVRVDAEQRSIDETVESRHMVTARQVSMLPENGGEVIGVGPGWYRGWMLTDRDQSILSDDDAPDAHLAGQILQGVHLTFRESMRSDLVSQTLAFDGGVRVGIRRLAGWDDFVDVDQMQRLALHEATMNCRTLTFGLTPGMPSDLRAIPGMPRPWEMKADGGVVMRARRTQGLYEATATQATYASKKSMLVVRGGGSQNAVIRHTNPQGKLVFSMPFPQLALNPKTFELEMQVDSATVGNLPLPTR